MESNNDRLNLLTQFINDELSEVEHQSISKKIRDNVDWRNDYEFIRSVKQEATKKRGNPQTSALVSDIKEELEREGAFNQKPKVFPIKYLKYAAVVVLLISSFFAYNSLFKQSDLIDKYAVVHQERLENTISTLALSGFAIKDKERKASLLIGLNFIINDELLSSKKHLVEHISTYPDDIQALIYLAKIEIATNDYSSAKKYLELLTTLCLDNKYNCDMETEWMGSLVNVGLHRDMKELKQSLKAIANSSSHIYNEDAKNLLIDLESE